MSEAATSDQQKIAAPPRLQASITIMSSTLLLSACLARDMNNSSADDTISVRKENNTLIVKYYDGDSKRKYELNLGKTSLWTYVKSIYRMFSTDVEPFKMLQLNFHGFPTYALHPNSLNDDIMQTLEDVSNMVSNGEDEDPYADMPPLISFAEAQARSKRTHSYY